MHTIISQYDIYYRNMMVAIHAYNRITCKTVCGVYKSVREKVHALFQALRGRREAFDGFPRVAFPSGTHQHVEELDCFLCTHHMSMQVTVCYKKETDETYT